jgi:nucleotide-binding universal stress UspA family protein
VRLTGAQVASTVSGPNFWDGAARALLLGLAEIVTMSITRILVPTDFSDAATRALEYGSRLASTLGAELTIVHIVAPPTTHSWMEGADPDGETTEAWLTEAHAMLADAVASVRDQVPAVRGTIAIGLEAEEILDFTSRQSIDLIVMGMHGHGRTQRWLRGSVTNQVLRRAPCPVLAIPACAEDGHAPEIDSRLTVFQALTRDRGARLAS